MPNGEEWPRQIRPMELHNLERKTQYEGRIHKRIKNMQRINHLRYRSRITAVTQKQPMEDENGRADTKPWQGFNILQKQVE